MLLVNRLKEEGYTECFAVEANMLLTYHNEDSWGRPVFTEKQIVELLKKRYHRNGYTVMALDKNKDASK